MSPGFALAILAFAVVIATGAIWFRRALAVAIPARIAPFVVGMALGIALAVAALVQGAGWIGGALAVLALVGGGFFLFSSAIGRQRGGPGAFRVGERVPDFAAPDDSGETLALSSLVGAPLLLKFFRGHW